MGYSQQLLFFNIEAQIPSQECYNIMQDSKGYIWFSTEAGLCRYANGRLQVFDRKNGLQEEAVYAVKEDAQKNLWFLTAKNRILRLDGNKLRESTFSSHYNAFTRENTPLQTPHFLDVNKQDELYIGNRSNMFKAHTKTGKIEKVLFKSDADFVFLKEKGSRLRPLGKRLTNSPVKKEVKIAFTTPKGNHIVSVPGTVMNGQIYWQSTTCLAGDVDFLSIGERLIRVNADFSISVYKLSSRILSIYADKNNGLWVGTLKNGVYYYPDVQSMELAQHNLQGYSVTGTCEDSEQGIWCSTLERGIFYSRNKHITTYFNLQGLDKRSTLLKSTGAYVFSSSSATGFFSFQKGAASWHPLPFSESNGYLDINRKGKGWMVSGIELLLTLNQHFRFEKRHMVDGRTDHFGSFYQFTDVGKSTYGIMYYQLFQIDENNRVTTFKKLPFIGRSILALSDSELLIGGPDGLHSVNLINGNILKIKGLEGNVTKMLRLTSGSIWITTKGNGIFWMNSQSKSATPVPCRLPTRIFFDITEDLQGRIWAGSNSGLICFEKAHTGYGVSIFNTITGLPSNEVYAVTAGNERLYFSTFEGLLSFPLNEGLKNTHPPAVYLLSVKINDKKIPVPESGMRVPYDQNAFRFELDVLTFKNMGEPHVYFQLKSDESIVKQLQKGTQISLESLDAGTYQLSVWAVNNEGVKSANPVLFTFVIDHPYWLTWWFILLAICVAGMIVWIIVRMIAGRIRRKEEAKTSMNKLLAEYQMNALQAQMNPHFIFNAITTIQGYILRKNEEDAYGYLSKFSKLIRMVLTNSQGSTIVLREELETLKLYIELEQLRFDNCFDFELRVSPEVEPNETFIPGMLLQPYIENAIWHGIVNLEKTRRGKLNLDISYKASSLLITITDNGIGRELAKSFRKDINHKSMAMELTEKRMKAINQLKDFENAQVTITDLFDKQNDPAGTQVVIILPVIQYYE